MPDGILTPDVLERRIEAAGRKLEELLTEIEDAGQKAAAKEATFKAAFARARLLARAGEGRVTDAMADDRATVDTEGQRLDHLMAAARLTSAREAMRARQSQLDALRSLMVSHRAAGG